MSGMAAEANEASRSLCGSCYQGRRSKRKEKIKKKRKKESDQRCPEVEVMTEERGKSRQRSGAMI